MTIAWRQFNDVNSNFRQGGWGYTTDGGMHVDISPAFWKTTFSGATR